MDEITRDYGIRIVGFGNVLFVSPHSAEGFEAGVNYLVAKICVATGASAIINTQILRSRVDLNRFDQINDNFLMVPAVGKYFNDLWRTIVDLKEKFDHPVVIFMHFCPRVYIRQRCLYQRVENGALVKKQVGESRDFDIDIGCGLTMINSGTSGIYAPAKQIIPSRGRGRPTIDLTRLIQIQNSLSQGNHLKVMVGREWAAANRENMVQWSIEHYNIDTVQLEICSDVAESDNVLSVLCKMVNDLK